MKRVIACLLCLTLLLPTVASAAMPVRSLSAATLAELTAQAEGQDPVYIVLVPEEVATNGDLISELMAYPTPMGLEGPKGSHKRHEGPTVVLGVPPLIWGLILSLPGVIVVRLNSEERSNTQKALVGAGINLAVLTVLYFTVFSPVTKGH